ncbi:MAG: signal recognition particle-docking protein FtsY [Actinobacteria bacterium RBG_19FT_COMBO_70_19]|nr:MAG: signal recognition particle-docking protein FtsY [Actinobacteria bacterium RBG_19FT_COMBO_70_19]
MLTWVAVVTVVIVVALALLFLRARRGRVPGTDVASAPERTASAWAVVPLKADGLGSKVRALFAGKPAGAAEWGALEELLVKADVGPTTAARIVGDLRHRYEPGDDPAQMLAAEVVDVLSGDDTAMHLPDDRLGIVLVVGVNGSGKTTTVGKLAARLGRDGKEVSLAGSDTFRAAASEQLDVWAQRAGAQLVSQERGADPGAVAFDAVKSAEAKGMDVLIVDTAGRLHTKTPLMDELQKVRRVIQKASGRTPDETLLVLDATTGQNGIAQARAFTDAVEVTGVALTKLDGTAKGGVVLAVREQLGVPVKLIGIGEGVDDLQPFDARAFAERLLAG